MSDHRRNDMHGLLVLREAQLGDMMMSKFPCCLHHILTNDMSPSDETRISE